MAHRPYSNVERARAQAWRSLIGAGDYRRYRYVPQRVPVSLDAWRPDFAMDGRTGEITPYPAGEYILSTRRPGVVGGGS